MVFTHPHIHRLLYFYMHIPKLFFEFDFYKKTLVQSIFLQYYVDYLESWF